MGRRRVAAWVLLAITALGGCRQEPEPAADPERSEMLDRISRPAEGGAVHLVRMVQRGDQYAFDPADLRIAQGDLVRFVMTGPQPESIVFDATDAPPEVASFIREAALDRGVLLTEPGQLHDVTFAGAPPGSYPFFSLPHADRGMRGRITVTE